MLSGMSQDDAGRDYGRAHARAAVEDAMNAKGMTVQNLADEAGVWVGSVRGFLDASSWPRARSLWRIEDALGWQRGRIAAIVRENEIPTTATTTEEPTPAPRAITEAPSGSPLLTRLLDEVERLSEDDQLDVLLYVRDLRAKNGDNQRAV